MTAGAPDHEPSEPRIAVIVMAYGLRRSLADAVRSAQRQDTPAEIVVVHSGDGDAAAHLREAGINVRVLRSDQRLLPGATRNAGIAATRAPVVSFLADDCIAELGALRERLKAHDSGARSVASALLCHQPSNPCALAAHLSLYTRRMPRAAPEVALKYGASYARTLFDEAGLFREDIESGEDTEFHQRLHGPKCARHIGALTRSAPSSPANMREEDAWLAPGQLSAPTISSRSRAMHWRARRWLSGRAYA